MSEPKTVDAWLARDGRGSFELRTDGTVIELWPGLPPDILRNDPAGLDPRLAAALEREARLREALIEFGAHDADCVCAGDKTTHAAECANCDCGLGSALAAAQPPAVEGDAT